jgi:hypothetical protein
MSRAWLLLPFLLSGFLLRAQKLEDGLWNSGRSNSIIALNNPGLTLQNQLSLVKLFPGFAVVRSLYDIRLTSTDSSIVSFSWPDTITSEHRFFQQIHNLPPAARTIIVDGDTLFTGQGGDLGRWQITFGPGQLRKLETLEICPTSQGKLFADGNPRELNAFVFSFNGWQGAGNRRVFVELAGKLSLNNMVGVYPANVEGTLERLKWRGDSLQQEMVIWYEGAAPDYNFEKKVLPRQGLLLQDIGTFDLALFDAPGFKKVNKTDFATNKRSLVGTIVYFALFTIPWLILLAFIVFLIRKPKKKS